MRLAMRDAYATVAVAVGLALALSVTQGWDWPLMNGVRAGLIALGLTGIVACSVSGWGSEGAAAFKNPFGIIGSVLGVAVLGIIVIGLFVDTMPYVVWAMAAMTLLWLVTVVHRLMPARHETRGMTTA